MSTPLKELEIKTLSEYMKFVEDQQTTRWYRGCGNPSIPLLPSLYRHPKQKDSKELMKIEQDILNRFKQRSIPYQLAPMMSDPNNIYTLFLMQHYGVPTRLLDWTENPYIGLFFALTDVDYEITETGDVGYLSDAVVWALNPEEWNQKTYNLEEPPGIISPIDDPNINGNLPNTEYHLRRKEPIALYGIHNNPRIVAQKGVFMLFGTATTPMEITYRDLDYPIDCIQKLLIKANNVSELLKQLIKIGITDSVVYPDLGGLASELKRYFGYWY